MEVNPGVRVKLKCNGEIIDRYFVEELTDEYSINEIITYNSPVGNAILYKNVGDMVKARIDDDNVEVEILDVRK